MSEATLPTLRLLRWPSVRIATPVLVLGLPLLFLLIGLVLRYLGYAEAVGDETLTGFPMGLCRWDCGWYIRIAEAGYDPFPVPSHSPAGNWAFFPLMPMFVGLVHRLTLIPTMTAATLVSLALSYATAVIAWPLFERDMRAYALFAAYLLAGPFSVYFTTFMTEPMFILLTTGAFVALKRRDYLGAGMWSALLSATRIVGVYMTIAILIRAVVAHREDGGTWTSLPRSLLRRSDLVVALFLAPLGFFAYMAFLQGWMGDGFAFLHVQRAWSRPSGDPFVFVWDALTNWPTGTWMPTFSQQLGVATVVGFALIGVLAWRRRWPEASFAFIALSTPLFAGMASMLRFVSATAPLPILLCQLLARWRIVFILALLGFFAADYWVAIHWIKGALSLV